MPGPDFANFGRNIQRTLTLLCWVYSNQTFCLSGSGGVAGSSVFSSSLWGAHPCLNASWFDCNLGTMSWFTFTICAHPCGWQGAWFSLHGVKAVTMNTNWWSSSVVCHRHSPLKIVWGICKATERKKKIFVFYFWLINYLEKMGVAIVISPIFETLFQPILFLRL